MTKKADGPPSRERLLMKKRTTRTTALTQGTVRKQRKIQGETDARDARSSKTSSSKAKEPPKTTANRRPASPLPPQHLRKPGLESELAPRPQFQARGYMGSGKLAGKVALITGGDSGIGRAVGVLFAREGADVAIVYLSEHSDAKETARHIENEGRSCLLISGDVRDESFCRDAVNRTIGEFGKLDVLVNNAAFQEHAPTIETLTSEHFDFTVKTNLYGYFHMAKASLPHMKSGACIINTGSETGLYGSKELLDYSATKGAIHAFTKALAANVIDRGIRVNAVAPGPVWTPLNPADRSAADVAEFGAKTDMKRPAQPDEISPAYVFQRSPMHHAKGEHLDDLPIRTGEPIRSSTNPHAIGWRRTRIHRFQ
jgi:NAD(P)-dependent dehydrogenase (short-subunit alcohol dehydrogenase family)